MIIKLSYQVLSLSLSLTSRTFPPQIISHHQPIQLDLLSIKLYFRPPYLVDLDNFIAVYHQLARSKKLIIIDV